MLSCDVCMLSVVLRPNTEPVDTESDDEKLKTYGQLESFKNLGIERIIILFLPGMMTKDPWGSMATRQALRMLGVSAAEMPHILQVSFRRLLRD